MNVVFAKYKLLKIESLRFTWIKIIEKIGSLV